ncbi:alpha/beta fold hydrolase [Actinosynnema sp. NPDC020468]|uniref:alpha/beta fold hydrolase n=1 Tax=Actinosynnema sp. NPDC020468 TaxID=3154488 RepID=UPI0033DF8889
MNDVGELKRHIVVHGRSQGLTARRMALVLDRVHHDGDGPGSWVGEWSAVAAAHDRAGRPLDASRLYALARFPYVDGPARARAQERCVDAFDRWAADRPGVGRITPDLPGGPVPCLVSGLSTTDPKPLLLVLGGIVSVKEQWAPILAQATRMGMAALVAELPGVGQNPLRYDADSWRLLPALLDAVKDRADVSATHAIALSFGGHLALRAAAEDPRLRGVVTAGAPVSRFFTDPVWRAGVPRITTDTLDHLSGGADLTGLALTREQLRAVRIPVAYAVSARDGIIPRAESELLRACLDDVTTLVTDDVHGSPDHATRTRLWTVLSVQRMRGATGPQPALLAAAVALLGATSAVRRPNRRW